jgi:CubicO group peptidase (beta-lactamase class C family)
MVTAILAFKLIEQGRLGLDDTLADFHPDMPAAAQISVRQMLAHSSGLGNFAIKDGTVWIVDALEPPAILTEIRRQGVAFTPGTRVAYSNSENRGQRKQGSESGFRSDLCVVCCREQWAESRFRFGLERCG